MDPITPDAVPGVASTPGAAADGQDLESGRGSTVRRLPQGIADPLIAAMFQQARDSGSLERTVMAWAVHPMGPAFDRARWLVWNPARELLVGRLWWGSAAEDDDPAEVLARAQRSVNDGPDSERTASVRAIAVPPEQLAGVAEAAWNASSAVIGAEARAGEHTFGPAAAFGALALSLRGRRIALLIGEWDAPGEEVARAAALARLRDLAIAAFETLPARDEARRRHRHAGAVGEFTRACVSSLNLAEVLDLGGRLTVDATEARGGVLWLADASGAPEIRVAHGPQGTRERLARALSGLAVEAMERARPLVLDRVTDDARLDPDVAAQIESLVVHPLMAYGRAVGAIAIYDRCVSHPAQSAAFDRSDVEFLATMADLVALAEDQTRRCEGLRSAEHRARELQREIGRNERLAALGEMAARVAHEVRNPLASIGAFARRVHQGLGADDPGREYLEIVIREAERLEGMVGEQLQYVSIQRPRLKLESMNAVLQEALQAAGERMVRRRVRLLKKLTPDLPTLLLDSERIRRVIGNILDNALEAVAPGGRVRVESRRSGAFVIVDVASDGQRRPGDLMEQLFVPFALSRQGGPGVGLAVAQQVLKQHGGEMRVRSEGEWSTIFSLTLPIHENQDRRNQGHERRLARGDRRERFPAA